MLCVRDVMTPDPVTIGPEANLRDAVELLTQHGISGMPVVRGVRVLGTLSARDIIAFEASTPGVPTKRDGDEDVWVETTPLFADDTDTPPSAFFADLWEDAGVDVAERFRNTDSPEWDLLAEHTVDEAMSRGVLAVRPSSPLQAAAEFMKLTGAHRVLVIDGDRLVGIITPMDITRAVADHRLRDREYVWIGGRKGTHKTGE
jgi:CBS domain-containing protein